ncbi:TIGR03943 family protein [Lachnospiraceae bacterium KH1T2]|nr:TIGR03943 family protein [Lachnospiraceae bacterium KH1T2]
MFKKREVPIYIFTGFLESGKTSFIEEVLKEGQFEEGGNKVLIVCEEGEVELDEALLAKSKFKVYTFEDESEVTPEKLMEIEKSDRPETVLVEWNGMWDENTLIEAFPDQWMIAEGIATVNAVTYEDYLNNMKMLMLNQFNYADLIVFNRCKEEMDLAGFKRTARAKNRGAQVIFEMADGTINDKVKEELPYDITAPVIEIADDDFGIWYLDCFDNMDKYIGKVFKFKGVVYKPKKGKPDVFVPGRFAMTCCAEDIQFVGFPCKYEGAADLKEKQFVMVTARMDKAMSKTYGQEAPVLYAESVEKAEPAKEEVVYFQ